jgi:hypothetical protein
MYLGTKVKEVKKKKVIRRSKIKIGKQKANNIKVKRRL